MTLHVGEKYDFVFKFVLIGDSGTGKSCLLHQFVDGKFRKGPAKHTIGVEFGSRAVTIGGKKIKLQIWDTAGQERFRSVTRSYYRGAAGALIVYDLTSRETFEHLKNWCNDSRLLASKDISIMLIGNKCDLKGDRIVTFLEASRFAQEQDCMFLETSALTGENVDEVFLKCARTVLSRIESGLIDPVTFAGVGSDSARGLDKSRHIRDGSRCLCCKGGMCCKGGRCC
jgi:Ras-related protein Rab-4B